MLDTNSSGHLPQCHAAGLRHEIVSGIFRAQPHFDRMAGEFNVVLSESQRFAAGDAQLQLDQI